MLLSTQLAVYDIQWTSLALLVPDALLVTEARLFMRHEPIPVSEMGLFCCYSQDGD